MVDRFCALLDRQLDPSVARAILILASAILLGLAALLVLATSEPDDGTGRENDPPAAAALFPDAPPAGGVQLEPAEDAPPARRQDPQDEEGSLAARRAASALRFHRALQHIPYRSGELTVDLVGARGDRAVLRVSAPTPLAAKHGWRRFLRRFGDSGRAYLPVFKSRGRDG